MEVHDSGSGLERAQARSTLFEPSISFKKGGMGLGLLSIARRSPMLCGPDLESLEPEPSGELPGAAFPAQPYS